MTTIAHPKDLLTMIGEDLGSSPWLDVSQERINLFADATDDHQWIHVDVERAMDGPFGGPIAHGYLTLSLIPSLVPQIIEISGFRMGVNYGTEKVRFPSPVPVGARVRAGATLEAATPFDGGVAMNLGVTMEIEGGTKPAMVATVVYRRYL
jgi:acyl dehydratase